VPTATAQLWAAVQASDYPARAQRLADEILSTQADVVGLQEVELFRRQEPSDFDFAAPTRNATTAVLDFQQLLLDALASRGASYRVAVQSLNADAELPMEVPGGGLVDLRLTDSDSILVREPLATAAPATGTFTHHITVRVGGPSGVDGDVLRGYGSVEVTLDDRTFTVVNTHLEVGGGLASLIQDAQAEELLQALGPMSGPVVLLGDFNSPAGSSAPSTYARLTAAFTDAWPVVSSDSGFTCCSELSSPTFDAATRIDLVLYRGRVRAEAAERVGTDPAGRTPGGLWPSDHAGVAATLGIGE
jgi:endonuclease/exonuclease/phosphatase family metal-dependent hydrolase